MLEEKPHLIISVPQVWESLYQKMIIAISQMLAVKRGLMAPFIKINQIFLTSLHYLRGGYIRLNDLGGFR